MILTIQNKRLSQNEAASFLPKNTIGILKKLVYNETQDFYKQT